MNADNRLKDTIDFLKIMEFKGIDEKNIDKKMQLEKGAFQINGVMNIDDIHSKVQLAYTVFFKKYDKPDTHLPDKFRVMLTDQPECQGMFLFDDRHPITARNAFHLLQGRAIMKPASDEVQLWYQMDFSKRDLQGDGLVRMYAIHKSEFDLEKQLEGHSIKEMQQSEHRQKLLNKLYNGEPVLVTVNTGEKDKLMQLEMYPKGPLLNGREVTRGESQSERKRSVTQKQSWEIPIEKKHKRKKGMSL